MIFLKKYNTTHKNIFLMAGPIILANMSQPLLGLADNAVTGHLDAPYYLGGVAIGAVIFSFIYWGFGFLRMGMTGPVAQAIGAKDKAEIRILFLRGAILALFLAFLLLLIQFPLGNIAVGLMGASDQVGEQSLIYYHIRIFSAPATLLNYVILGWFLGQQKSLMPMLIQTSGHAVNIILSILFVFKFNWNVAGVASATVIAEYITLSLMLIITYRQWILIGGKTTKPKKIFTRNALKKLFFLNMNIFIRTLSLLFALAFFTSQSTRYRDVGLAANTILMQFIYISAFALDGFAFVAEALTGKGIGARKWHHLKIELRLIFFWSFIIALLFTLFYAVFGRLIIALITDLDAVRLYADNYLWWAVMIPIFSSWCYIWDGVFLGATQTSLLRNAMIISVACYVIMVVWFQSLWGNHGLWLALYGFMIIRALSLWGSWHLYSSLSKGSKINA